MMVQVQSKTATPIPSSRRLAFPSDRNYHGCDTSHLLVLLAPQCEELYRSYKSLQEIFASYMTGYILFTNIELGDGSTILFSKTTNNKKFLPNNILLTDPEEFCMRILGATCI
jgi:hypothetical protein